MSGLEGLLDAILKDHAAHAAPPPATPRIRYWELPSRMDQVNTPYLVIMDRWPEGAENTDQAGQWGDNLTLQTGARGTLIFPFEVEIGESK